MKKVINLFNLIFLFLMSTQVMAAKEEGEKVNSDVFSIINLDYPGLESVKAEYQKGNERRQLNCSFIIIEHARESIILM